MAARLALVKKTEPQIQELINEGKGYEALRLMVTISNRYHSLKSYNDALRVSYTGAVDLLTHANSSTDPAKLMSAGFEASNNYVNLAKKINFLDDSIISNIKTLFSMFPITTAVINDVETPQVQPHIDFMKSCLAFCRSFYSHCLENPQYALKTLDQLQLHSTIQQQETEPNPNPTSTMGLDDFTTDSNTSNATTDALQKAQKYEATLHHTFASFCFKQKLFDLGNNHFIYAFMPVQHVLLLTPHISALSLHEQGFALIRLTAMYLCVPHTSQPAPKGPKATTPVSITMAEKFLHTLTLKLSSKTVQPLTTYLHCAQNLITVAKLGDLEAFNTLTHVYSVIIEKNPDKTIYQFTQRIGEIYCGLKKQGGLLDALFA